MKKYLSILALIIVVAFTIAQFIPNKAEALITLDTNKIMPSYRVFDFFATSTAVSPNYGTTTATSTGILPYFDAAGRLDNGIAFLSGANRATFYFSRQGGASANVGSSTFKVQVTPDGTNWYDYNRLIQASTTVSVGSTIEVGSLTIGGTTTAIASMDLTYDTFYGVRCISVILTDGLSFCKVAIGN